MTRSPGPRNEPQAAKPLIKTGWPLLFAGPASLMAFAFGVWLLAPVQGLTLLALLSGSFLLFAALAWWPWAASCRRIIKLEQERDATCEELLRTSRTAGLGELASAIAHDINNPLAIMHEEAGWIQDLLQRPDAGGKASLEEIANSASQIEAQIRRSREITRRILDWTRDGGRGAEVADFNALLNKTLYLMEGELQSSGVRVAKHFAAKLPLVKGQASEWQQVFLNLIKNALDAMRPVGGGLLTLSTSESGGEVRAVVGDTGPGIPPEDAERIFEPFFTTKAAGEGTGLGLPVSRWIARKQGGSIGVESRPGHGALFMVTAKAAKETTPDAGDGNG